MALQYQINVSYDRLSNTVNIIIIINLIENVPICGQETTTSLYLSCQTLTGLLILRADLKVEISWIVLWSEFKRLILNLAAFNNAIAFVQYFVFLCSVFDVFLESWKSIVPFYND